MKTMSCMSRSLFVVACLVTQVLTSGFALFREGPTEMAMCKGMVVEATNENGTILIEAGEGTERTYQWNRRERALRLQKRHDRWYGSMGMKTPVTGKPVHFVLQEGQQHFCSEKEVLEWLVWSDRDYKWVYTSDGFVVGWNSAKLKRKGYDCALHVDVWQIFINGKRPANLPGAENDRVQVTVPEDAKLPVAGLFIPSKPEVINGRLYSGKALDFMKEKDIPSEYVEKAITLGRQMEIESSPPGWAYYWWEKFLRGSIIVVLDGDGRVVRVTR